jgi:hypothetical protein
MVASEIDERFASRMAQPDVARDTRTVGDFIAIWCKGNHADRERGAIVSDAAALGVYGRKPPVVCAECADHLRYAERRRALCPKDPKPFCAHCDTHCYRSAERAWQQEMMRYSGPRSALHGYAIEGIRHALEARKWRREAARREGTNAAE